MAAILFCHAAASPRRSAASAAVRAAQPAGRVLWLYLGRNYRRMLAWEHALGPAFERLSYTERLQTLALEWRSAYLNWTAELGAARDDLEWWSSRLAERNTLLDSLYHSICYLKIGLESIEGERPPRLVVVENPALLETLLEQARRRGPARLISPLSRLLLEARLRFRGPLVWARFLADGLLALVEARWTRGRRPRLPAASSQPRIVLHTCIDESYFGADGVPHDRYFPGLAETLRQRGYAVMTVPWLEQIQRPRWQAFAWFRQHPGEYLIPEDFYTFADYLWAVGVVRRQGQWAGPVPAFQGLEISRIVRDYCRRQGQDHNAARFVRYHRLVQHWARLGLKFEIFIDMFENMIAEKPQVLALRRWMPATRTVGFQHYGALLPLMLCLFTTPAEAARAPHPDIIVCNAPLTLEQLRAAGFPAGKLRLGASLRYPHLQATEQLRVPAANTVLVVLPLETAAAQELVWYLGQAFPHDEQIRFWIKPHPMMRPAVFQALAGGGPWPAHLQPVSGRIADWLEQAACAVMTATTAALEVALMGVPVVLVGRSLDFDQNPLAWFPELEPPVHSPPALRAEVQRCLHLGPAERRQFEEWAERMRQSCYSPLTETTLAAFVDPPAAAVPGLLKE